MKLKLFFLIIVFAGGLTRAQVPYHSLIITEAFIGNANIAYFEISNVGNENVQLSEFKFAEMRPWGSLPWQHDDNRWFMLPEYVLAPGESYVISGVWEFGPAQFAKGLDGYTERIHKADMDILADLKIHVAEPNGDETDIVDWWGHYMWIDIASGRSCYFLEHHFPGGEPVVVDQINGWFDGSNGLNIDKGGYDIAGVSQASANSYLIRKFNVKTGNLDFPNAAGVGPDDGEWIVVPVQGGVWRKAMWTAGNHGDYNLDENTLESDVIDIDFANKTLTVPWGIRDNDDIMNYFVKKPGIAWQYLRNRNTGNETFVSAQSGDKLRIWVCGNDADVAIFDIIVEEPSESTNIIVPKYRPTFEAGWPGIRSVGQIDWPRVSRNLSGLDTITGVQFGLPFALRTDSLLKYLEKAPDASWEFVWVDGTARPDLKEGDKLKVTAQNGAVKEYYIEMQEYTPKHIATLSAITCPDLSSSFKMENGWSGDTIPNFAPTVYNYSVRLPFDITGTPAFVAKTSDLNAKVDVQRAINLDGTTEQRTIVFTVTAEDNNTINIYNIILIKEKNPANVQPFHAEPFLSELVFWDQWSNNFGEIANPGNQPLDLSDYMIVMAFNPDPASVIQSRMGTGEWFDRFDKYVPGYKWVNENQWSVTPGILVYDPNVNPIIKPGDVFAFGAIFTDNQTKPGGLPNYVWPIPGQLDVQFNNYTGFSKYNNPWGEAINSDGNPIRKWMSSNWYMFKILNDSIKLGLKPANDPDDFELIERFGMADGSPWVIGGIAAQMITNWMRKPNIYKGNPVAQGSFGSNQDDTEWTWTNQTYWEARGVSWPLNILNIVNDIGQHFMNEPTLYKSTVSSLVYWVSEGYSVNEKIKVAETETTADGFINNLIKANENQTLNITRSNTTVTGNDLLVNGDILTVISADGTNTTIYNIEFSEQGLSSNAVLTSSVYNVQIIENLSTISGFGYETSVRSVFENVVVPVGARLNIIDEDGKPVPLQNVNLFGEYVDILVSSHIYFEVVAEDNVTVIYYQLLPEYDPAEVFVLSQVYTVNQDVFQIKFVPRGTTVASLISNLVSSPGASVQVKDKMGFERVSGIVSSDDQLVVTSQNEEITKVYSLFLIDPNVVPANDKGFDFYNVGDYLAVVDKNWTTWSNQPGGPEDGLITSEQAHSAPNSVKVDGSTDLIFPMGNLTTGRYELNFNAFVPFDKVGYFNVQHFENPGQEFAIQCFLSTNGQGELDVIGKKIYFGYNQNEWVNFGLIVDLDNDVAIFQVNQTEIFIWKWSLKLNGAQGINQLGCLDFYAATRDGVPLMYFDDVVLKQLQTVNNINIGLVGTFNNWGNSGMDVPLIQDIENAYSWSVDYSFNEAADVKFRQNNNWSVNWGNSEFPNGIAYLSGPNIPVPAGNYHLSFNSYSGEYNFETIDITCNPSDSLALVAIYNATNGSNWGNKSYWLSGKVQTWFGVTLNTDGRVTGLNLARNGLYGFIPPEIGNLTALQRLHLGNNMFVNQGYGWNNLQQQPLPNTLAILTNLEVLSLDNLYMNNEMPDMFGGMTELHELYIQNNYFNNPGFPGSIASCINLQRMEIYYNNFYDLPDLTSLTQLSVFQADGCLFGFDDIEPNLWIPQFNYYSQRLLPGNPESLNPQFGETISRTIETGGTQNIYQWLKDGQELTGQNTNTLTLEDISAADAGIYTLRITNSLATQLTLMSHPIILYQNQSPVYKALVALYNSTGGDNWNWNNNWLSNQPITTWEGINLDSWNGKYYLSLYNNNLVGTLPSVFGDLSLFYSIDIANNTGLTGEIPASVGQLSNLENLNLSNNNLSGTIPPEIKNCSNLRYFYIHNNQISGLPTDLTGMDLYGVELWNNKLEFDDIIPWMGVAQNWFSYLPQRKYGEPEAHALIVGSSVTFNGIAGGDGNLYKWYKNDELMQGQTGSQLVFASITTAEAGTYECRVTNPAAPNLTLISEPKSLYDASGLDAWEPDNFFKYAQEITGTDYQQHSLFPAGDMDIAWFEITQPSQVQIWFSNGEWGSRQLTVYAADTTTILANGSDYCIFTAMEPGIYYVKAWSQNSEIISEYFLDIEILPFTPDNYEPDNNFTNAKQITPFFSQTDHNLKPAGDVDYVKFEITDAPRTVTLEVYNEVNCRNFNLWLYGSDGVSQLAFSNSGAKNCGARLDYTISENGTYYLKTKVPWQEMYDYYTISVVTDGQPPVIACNLQDSLALVAIYNSTSGPYWWRNYNWLNGNVQSWYGVTLNKDGRVIKLNLEAVGMDGYLPEEIGNLTELERLHLGSGVLFGPPYNGSENYLRAKPLPNSLDKLIKLQILSLNHLYLRNELPNIFENMSSLRELYIQDCYFTNQSLPTSISACTNLEKLVMYNNNFYDLPDLSMLTKLSDFQTNSCYLGFDDIEPNLWISGFSYGGQRLMLGTPESLNPAEGETVTRAITVEGAYNIYQWLKDGVEILGQNTNTLILEDVSVSDAGIYTLRVTNSMATQLTLTSHPIVLYQSELPVYKALEALYNGTGGSNWNNKTNWLSNQPLTDWYGIFRNEWNGFYILQLNDNNLVGTLPQEIGDLKIFNGISIQGNFGLYGTIPSSLGELSDLQWLYLTNTNLSGAIPVEINNCKKLSDVALYNNQFVALPDLSGMTNLSFLEIENNKLEFDDIIPTVGQINNFYYSPQDSIGESALYNKLIGENFSHTLVTGGEQNQYQWYKDGWLLDGQTSATLEIKNLSLANSGNYFCAVTNPQATALKLYSKIITLTVEEPVMSCIELNFKTGWNIFSTPNQPDPASIETVFQPCIINNSLVKIQDEGGKFVEDWGIYGGWQNYIGDISPTEGYKVKVSKNDILEVCGAPVQYPFAIPLNDGWNIIGFPQTTAVDGIVVLQQLIDRGTLVKVQDEGGHSIEDWGIYGGWQNYIGDFVPGDGYALKVNADETLWIYESYPKSSAILPEVAATNHFKTQFEGNGVDHMNINLVGLPVNILRAGDELAIFDGSACVGAVTILSRNLQCQTASIAVSAKDNQGMSGFAEGNPVTLKLWNSKQNSEFILEPEIVKGTSTFAKHETTVASLEKYATTGLDGIAGNGLTEINCYPNPFSDEVTVEIILVKDSEVQVEVLNQLGQRVRFLQTEKIMNSGIHRLTWDGKSAENQQVSTGIYHLRIIVEDTILIRKLVYSK